MLPPCVVGSKRERGKRQKRKKNQPVMASSAMAFATDLSEPQSGREAKNTAIGVQKRRDQRSNGRPTDETETETAAHTARNAPQTRKRRENSHARARRNNCGKTPVSSSRKTARRKPPYRTPINSLSASSHDGSASKRLFPAALRNRSAADSNRSVNKRKSPLLPRVFSLRM